VFVCNYKVCFLQAHNRHWLLTFGGFWAQCQFLGWASSKIKLDVFQWMTVRSYPLIFYCQAWGYRCLQPVRLRQAVHGVRLAAMRAQVNRHPAFTPAAAPSWRSFSVPNAAFQLRLLTACNCSSQAGIILHPHACYFMT